MNGENVSMSVFAQCAHIASNFIVGNCKTKQLDNISAKVSKKLAKYVFECYLNLAIIPHWVKCNIASVLVSPGNAQTNFGWGGKLNIYLMTSCLLNIYTQNYWNLVILLLVTVENVRDVFFETQCRYRSSVTYSVRANVASPSRLRHKCLYETTLHESKQWQWLVRRVRGRSTLPSIIACWSMLYCSDFMSLVY